MLVGFIASYALSIYEARILVATLNDLLYKVNQIEENSSYAEKKKH